MLWICHSDEGGIPGNSTGNNFTRRFLLRRNGKSKAMRLLVVDQSLQLPGQFGCDRNTVCSLGVFGSKCQHFVIGSGLDYAFAIETGIAAMERFHNCMIGVYWLLEDGQVLSAGSQAVVRA